VKRILATTLAVIMLALLGAGCKQLAIGQVATSAGSVAVYTGHGLPPQQSGTGTWLKVGHDNWWWWVVTGGAVSAASIKALALAADAGRPAQPGPIAAAALINNPCNGASGKPKRGYTKIASWFVKITGQKLPYDPANEYLALNCYTFWQIMRTNAPARLKYLYDCIANILTQGIPLTMADEYRSITGKFGWSWNGGYVVADKGVIKEVKPANGGWGKCAKG
jgi:hypothetical protein